MRLLRNADRLLVVEPVDRMGERCQVLTDPRGPISEVVDAGICAFFLGEGTVHRRPACREFDPGRSQHRGEARPPVRVVAEVDMTGEDGELHQDDAGSLPRKRA